MMKLIPILLVAFVIVGAGCQKTSTTKKSSTSGFQRAVNQAFGALTTLSTTAPSANDSAEKTQAVGETSALIREGTVMPDIIPTVRYVFTGTPSNLTNTMVDVLERRQGQALSIPSALRTSAGLGVADFDFSNPVGITSVTIRHGQEYWTVSPLEGMISMYRTVTSGLMKGIAVGEPSSSGPVDTAVAVRIASAWLLKNGITTQSYGSPVVTGTPGYYAEDSTTIEIAPATRSALQPTTYAQVVYPFMIGRQPVVQHSGDPLGLTVTVDTEQQLVTALYGLTTRNYTTSAYPATTDFSVIQKFAEQGGVYNYRASADEATTTINLDTPDRVLMASYLYTNDQTRELYVPALRFALLNPPDGYNRWIVVPLVEELLTSTITPGIEPTQGGSSGSSGLETPTTSTTPASGTATDVTR